MEKITGPGWFLDDTGSFFLVSIGPDGTFDMDGGHSDIEGVVRARKLIKTIFNKPGVEFRAVQVVAIPDHDVPINDEAAALCRKAVQAAQRPA